MSTVSKVLIPLDGSEFSERIGAWLTSWTAQLGAEFILIAVVDQDKINLPRSTAEHGHPMPGAAGRYDRPGAESAGAFGGATGMVGGATITPLHAGAPDHAPAFGTQILDQVMEQTSDYLTRQSTIMNPAGLRFSTDTLVGDPAEAIVRYATDAGADLVAMATHRGSSVARGVLGSVTDRVLHNVGVPVMAIHPDNLRAFDEKRSPPETIIVPLDGSARSASVVDLALDLAEASDADILFTQVIRSPIFGLLGTEPQLLNAVAESSIHPNSADEYLSVFVNKAAERGLRSRHVLMAGSPAERIIEEVKLTTNPLVVMSTRGRSGIGRWMFGSVADKVVRSSGVPVVVVPPRKG